MCGVVERQGVRGKVKEKNGILEEKIWMFDCNCYSREICETADAIFSSIGGFDNDLVFRCKTRNLSQSRFAEQSIVRIHSARYFTVVDKPLTERKIEREREGKGGEKERKRTNKHTYKQSSRNTCAIRKLRARFLHIYCAITAYYICLATKNRTLFV